MIIFTKFYEDQTKDVDFLSMANFSMNLGFFYSDFTSFQKWIVSLMGIIKRIVILQLPLGIESIASTMQDQ